jgi:hypothetical protein
LSHLKEREEKVCLNCNTELTGRFCPNCGQENVEPKESAWHLINHFFSDLFHFDGKFFSTLKLLATKPGFLTAEYVKGRRAAHLNPIRMYLFVSALFFLIFMSFFLPKDSGVIEVSEKKGSTVVKSKKSPAEIARLIKEEEAKEKAILDSVMAPADSGKVRIQVGNETLLIDTNKKKARKTFLDMTLHEYDSLQKVISAEHRDGAIKRHYKRKAIAARKAWKEKPEEMQDRFLSNFFHSLPYMLFLSLPLIALLLKLIYIRRKEFYYVSHAIFTVHYYIFVFICLLVIFTLGEFAGRAGEIIGAIMYWGIYIYLFLAMKRFYRQGGFKTFIKFLIFSFLGSMIVGILALIGAINAGLNVAAVH